MISRLMRLRGAAGWSVAVRAAIAAGPAAALVADVFHHAFVAAFFHGGRGLLRGYGLENLAAARLINLLMVAIALAVRNALGADAFAMARHADIAALAGILDLGHFRDHGHDTADLRDSVAAAMRAAAAILGPPARSGKRQDKDGGEGKNKSHIPPLRTTKDRDVGIRQAEIAKPVFGRRTLRTRIGNGRRKCS